ncbi:hypothetical protein KRMM14A1259_33520 [Krasilnikovia sp. MM14-A1259]
MAETAEPARAAEVLRPGRLGGFSFRGVSGAAAATVTAGNDRAGPVPVPYQVRRLPGMRPIGNHGRQPTREPLVQRLPFPGRQRLRTAGVCRADVMLHEQIMAALDKLAHPEVTPEILTVT